MNRGQGKGQSLQSTLIGAATPFHGIFRRDVVPVAARIVDATNRCAVNLAWSKDVRLLSRAIRNVSSVDD
jgi:hypothetical protein